MSAPARILIVDDDEAVLQTFAKALSFEGYDVRVASTPAVGLASLEDAPPDAILLDLQMPFVNGLGFLYRLREREQFRQTPVAIITGVPNLDEPAVAEIRDLGADVWFKPMWIDELVNVARSLLARSASPA
jgi:two-component system response regulator MprA